MYKCVILYIYSTIYANDLFLPHFVLDYCKFIFSTRFNNHFILTLNYKKMIQLLTLVVYYQCSTQRITLTSAEVNFEKTKADKNDTHLRKKKNAKINIGGIFISRLWRNVGQITKLWDKLKHKVTKAKNKNGQLMRRTRIGRKCTIRRLLHIYCSQSSNFVSES